MKTALVLASPPPKESYGQPPLLQRSPFGRRRGAVKLNTSKCFIEIYNFKSDNNAYDKKKSINKIRKQNSKLFLLKLMKYQSCIVF